jgi:hypothetical protein
MKPTALLCRMVLVGALLLEAAVLVVALRHGWHAHILRVEVVSFAAFAVAVPALAGAGLPRRHGLLLVVTLAAVLQLGATRATPTSSDDVYRYAWDAKVQLTGIDPYRYVPQDEQLRPLRSAALFGERRRCAWRLSDGSCTRINRPSVRTVYPPGAEGSFTLSRILSLGRSDGPFPLQVMAAVIGIAVTVLLARRALHCELPPWTVALWGWCPVSVIELGNNGHVDGLAVLLSVGALIAARARRAGWTGILLGAAVVTKLYPLMLYPALVKHRPWRVILASVATGAAVYLPHVLAVGVKVIGFLPGYLKQEDYTDGSRFLLLAHLLPNDFVLHHSKLLAATAALLLAATAAVAYWRADPDRPEQTAVWLVGVVLLVTTPSYSWYALLLLALVAMTARWEWLALAVLPTLAMLWADSFDHSATFRTWCYLGGLAAAAIGAVVRHRARIGLRAAQCS